MLAGKCPGHASFPKLSESIFIDGYYSEGIYVASTGNMAKNGVLLGASR